MFNTLASLITGDSNKKILKRTEKLIPQINQFFDLYFNSCESKEDFQSEYKKLQVKHLEQNVSLDDLLPETFGLVKAACKFICGSTYNVMDNDVQWNMVPYDVQLIGGIVLHSGSIAEMKTGEGKTLVCTLPAILNSLTNRPVYVITVNEYLAKRDSQWMGFLYEFLGLTVSNIYSGQEPESKKQSYDANIVYGTNNEFGFDYLRDNMAMNYEQVVQKDLHFCIVDEVDSILIDEARTPLIISAPDEESTDQYKVYASLVETLTENQHYNIDEKLRVATLSEEGVDKIEQALKIDNIYAEGGFKIIHHIEQALKAKALFKKDIDYVVRDGEVMIVDEFTGRLMSGRRYSEGLHQAIEAKERVEILRESKTLASVTFQNYFRLFEKLSGMTGTAKTEEEEFYKIYGLNTVVIPTNKPIARIDLDDVIYKSKKAKYLAIAEQVQTLYKSKQPVLIGTASVEQSEILSEVFKLKGIKHEVLNAKNHSREAEIVANAGQQGSVTIATNMAGRGTDIKLGEGVFDLGGLYIIGTQRHESRRIDNQLRGRSGRQGDVGCSQFYLSLEDDLMRINGGERVQKAMTVLNVPDDMPITNKFINKAIESSQKRVEGRNFDMRKHVVEYDDVINYHREIVYKNRREVLKSESIEGMVIDYFNDLSKNIVLQHKDGKEYDYQEILETINSIHVSASSKLTIQQLSDISNDVDLQDFINDYFVKEFNLIKSIIMPEKFNNVLQFLYLTTIDTFWMEHIDDMGYLRQNVALHAYGQKDPLIVYKQEAYLRFKDLLLKIKFGFISSVFKAIVQK